MQILENSYTTLRAIGKDETWLHRWIIEKPSRLGLGDLVIKNAELVHYQNRGGRLDLLAYRGDLDTYYEIEVMLGECDADHGFRTLDYWARERIKNPNARHVGVLIAEDLSGRYKTVIETLPQFLPFIGIEIKVLRLEGPEEFCTIDTAIVSQPDDLTLDSGDEPANLQTDGSQPRDRAWWEANSNPTFMATVDALAKYCVENVGTSRLDYSAQSYVSLKKGRRCWLPMWPRATGVYVYFRVAKTALRTPLRTSTISSSNDWRKLVWNLLVGPISTTRELIRFRLRFRWIEPHTQWCAIS